MATTYPTGKSFKGNDLTGQMFGRLRVLSLSHSKHEHVFWLCRCECGVEKCAVAAKLRTGKTVSCGCYARTLRFIKGSLRPKRSHPRERGIWRALLSRCYNTSHANYASYGGRGIQVCDRWRESCEHFIEDMGHAPTVDHSLDRIDNNGNYEPGNCRWATRSEQARNKRNNRIFTFNGKTQCMEDWSNELGLAQGTLKRRVKEGWPIERILTTPGRSKLKCDSLPCKWCGQTIFHKGMCPRVKTIEFHENGEVKRVVFHNPESCS